MPLFLAGVSKEGSTDPDDTSDADDADAESDPVDADDESDAGDTDGESDGKPTDEPGAASDGDDTGASDAGDEPPAETATEPSRSDGGIDGTRLERSMAAVDFGTADRDRLETDDEAGMAELGIRAVDIESAYPAGVPEELLAQQARNLSNVREKDLDTDRANRVASIARKQAAKDVPPSAFVASHLAALSGLVDDAFDEIDDGADPEEIQHDLLTGVRATFVDMQVGVDEFAETDAVAPLADDEYVEEVTLEEIFGAIPYPSFIIDDEHTVLSYNVGLSRLLSLEDDHREFLGGDNRETIAAATYTDGKRHRSLVDKVAENPTDAEDHWDVERVDDENEYTDHIVYEDTSVTKDPAGNETHIAFLAVPYFDDDGELKGVYELVEDRSDEVLHQKSVTKLVEEVTGTLHDIGDGDLSARAEFEDTHDVVEDELLELTTDVNEMADSFEQLIHRVDAKTEELAESIERATNSAHQINHQVSEQNQSLEEVANEMEDFSATMEEVAASSNEVANAAEAALDEADAGVESGEDARDVTEEVMAISDDLVDTVEQLDDYMNEIGEVVEVIAEVADQTNMLALNANIEAARAGEAGSGFAVVADEVKNLANETQEHTEEIEDRIEMIQAQADETVDEVEQSHDRIQDAEREIGSALESLQTISETVETAADGIHEVANANDEQASTVEEVMATIDQVRDSANEVSSTTEEIVHEAEKQESAVFELSDRVRELSTTSEDGDAEGDHEQA